MNAQNHEKNWSNTKEDIVYFNQLCQIINYAYDTDVLTQYHEKKLKNNDLK